MWKTILVAVWSVVKPTLLSRKVQTAIIAMICHLGARWGLDFSVEAATAFVSPLLAAILGQGVADLKKPQPCPKCAGPVAIEGGGPPATFGNAPPIETHGIGPHVDEPKQDPPA